MPIYKGQATHSVTDVAFTRVQNLLAVGPDRDYDISNRTVAARHDLVAAIEMYYMHEADAGRIVVDEKHLRIGIINDYPDVGIPTNRAARRKTADLVRELNPGWKVDAMYEDISVGLTGTP